jgi:hypothetical protein
VAATSDKLSVGSIDFAFKEAAKGPAAYGSSAYVDQADENHTKTADLSSDANKRFGRNFQIYSLRWLNSSEI